MSLSSKSKTKSSVKRRVSLIGRIRSLTGSTDKQSPKTASTTTPPPTPPPPSPTAITGPPDFSVSPRVTRSRSFGDAINYSRRQHSQSPSSSLLFGAHGEFSTAATINEVGSEDCSDESQNTRNADRKNSTRAYEQSSATAPEGVVPPRSMRKRAASGGDVLLKPRSLSLVPTTTTNSSSSTKPSKANPPREKYSHLKASSPVGERLDRSKDWERSSSPRHDVVPVTKNESPSLEKDRDSGDRDRDHPGEETSKQKRKSVCVVPPSDVHAMRLTRSNSEKLPPEEGEAIHDAVAPRRSAGPSLSQSRKSMPSLSVAFDQQLLLDTENGGDLGDAGHRELRKSGGSGASTSGSNGGEIITTQIDSSSPKLPSSEYKKIVEYSDLPPHVSKSKNAKFHKLFKSVPLEEYPIDSYSCAFKGDILIHGMLYVSQNWICFYSKIRARGRLLEIPLEKVISITREKLALIIPNAIGIQIADQKYVFGSFMSRDNTYKLLVTLWKHSQDSTDSTNTKENELSCYEDFATKAGRRALVNGSRIEDDMTHSADVSGESDTTEDEDMEVPTDPSLLMDPSLSSMASRTSDGGGRDSRNNQQPDKVPGLFLLRCIDCRKMFVTLSNFAVKIQKAPRTNLLLAICSILVVFLLLSAMGLTYKILLLQTRLEMSHLWTPGRQHSFREQTLGSIYTLQSQTHMATIHQLHDVLKANIQILQQVHQSLKSLQVYTASEDCPTAK